MRLLAYLTLKVSSEVSGSASASLVANLEVKEDAGCRVCFADMDKTISHLNKP
jgi:hypothetical protein